MFHAVHRSDPNISLAMDRLLNNTELFKQKKKKKKRPTGMSPSKMFLFC